MATGEAAAFQAAANLTKPTECFPRPAKLAWRRPSPLEERHRASTYSLSIQQSTGSLPNVTLPPPLQRPSYSTCAPPRMSPCDVSFVQRETNWNSRKCPTPATCNQCRVDFQKKTEVYSASYHPSDAMSWVCEIEAVQKMDDLSTSFSTTGKPHPNFETLDAKIATA